MKELVEFLVRSIVQNPDEVVINQENTGNSVNIQVKVNQDDIKIVIGKEGKTIRAIRELARIKAIKDQVKVRIEVV